MTSGTLHRGLHHIAVHCFDLDATVRFYTEGLQQGLDVDHRPQDEDRAKNAALAHFAIRTDDPEEIFQRAVSAGARSFLEPTTIKTIGESPMTIEVGFVYGLNGEVIEFIKRP